MLGRRWCEEPGLHLLRQSVTQLHQAGGCCDELLTSLTFSIAQISDIYMLIARLTKGCRWPAPPPNIQSISEGRIKHTPLSTMDDTLDHHAMSTQPTPLIHCSASTRCQNAILTTHLDVPPQEGNCTCHASVELTHSVNLMSAACCFSTGCSALYLETHPGTGLKVALSFEIPSQ